MSLILDALKKLEQEKSSRKGKTRELGPAILQERRTERSFTWRPVILLSMAVICTAGVTVLLMRQFAPSDKTAALTATARSEHATAFSEPPSVKAPNQPSPTPPPVPVQPSAAAAGTKPVPVAAPSPAPAATEPATSSVPELKVSGIAWQEDREARRAVVNGALIREGAVVAGSRVAEILPDRVRFSVGGRLFDITNTTPFN